MKNLSPTNHNLNPPSYTRIRRTASWFLRVPFIALCIGFSSCSCFIGSTKNVSSDPRVAEYLAEPRQLTKACDLLANGSAYVLIEHNGRNFRHEGMKQQHLLPEGTRVDLTRIHRIQRDGFVIFRATGRAFPKGSPKGLVFTYEWGYGGTSPQAPWEPPGKRLKKLLGIEG